MVERPTRVRQHKIKAPWLINRRSTPHGISVYVGTLVKEYLASDRFNRLSPSSKRSYEAAIRKLERTQLYNGRTLFECRATQIIPSFLDYYATLLGRINKPATIRLNFAVMSAIWNFAKKQGRVWQNPWEKYDLKVNNERDVTLSKNEVDQIIAKAKELGLNLLARYVLFGYTYGARPWSDLLPLKWSNIIEQDGNKVISFVISKTKTTLMLPITEEIEEELKYAPKEYEYIFVENNGQHRDRKTISEQFNKVKLLVGLSKEVQFRDLRRTMVTELVMSGASDGEIEAITGWRSASRVIHRYARLRLRTASNAMAKLSELRNEKPAGVSTEIKS